MEGRKDYMEGKKDYMTDYMKKGRKDYMKREGRTT